MYNKITVLNNFRIHTDEFYETRFPLDSNGIVVAQLKFPEGTVAVSLTVSDYNPTLTPTWLTNDDL